jgi:hypothetical protein
MQNALVVSSLPGTSSSRTAGDSVIAVGLPHPVLVPYIPDGRCCFWFGWGGSLVVNDLDRRMTFAYVMNKMGISSLGGLGTERTKAYTRIAFSCADA